MTLKTLALSALNIKDPTKLLSLAKKIESFSVADAKNEGLLVKRVAVLTGYTSTFISNLLRLYSLQRGIFLEIFESDFGVFEQLIYSKDKTLADFKPDLAYLCVGSDHLSFSNFESETQRWLNLTAQAKTFLGCDIIINTFEEPTHRTLGNYETRIAKSDTRFIQALNLALAEKLPAYVHLNDVNFLAATIGRKNFRNESIYDLSKIPVAYDHLGIYAENLASVVAAVFGKSKKCLVLDLDNTLWGGIVGDDGFERIAIGEDAGVGEAHHRFQTLVKKLKDRGIILAVCSKNEGANAREPFLKRAEMVLTLDDISCFVANWDPKPQNIRRIAETLEIGLDSMVFVDDNPAEREIVRQQIPEVTVIEMPEDPAEYTAALASTFWFETISLTKEDLARTEQYRANAQRTELQQKTASYEDYLKSLEMRATVREFTKDQIPRVAQLINKTNQFNVTTKRYTEAEVLSFSQQGDTITRTVSVADRFGDNGLISVFIGKAHGKTLDVDTWLMSCRVLKRDVEHLLFSEVLKAARQKNLSAISATYIPTEKNGLVKDLFRELGFSLVESASDGATRWSFDLADQTKISAVAERVRPLFRLP